MHISGSLHQPPPTDIAQMEQRNPQASQVAVIQIPLAEPILRAHIFMENGMAVRQMGIIFVENAL